ncbi:ABC transporter permease [Mesorhizobium sp. M8A.F.Ca.ET.173.01.1.1]|nr:ABC transporter permease [Mesorhizobium sp. M8A.F.Ca.ET.173.01.1.1]
MSSSSASASRSIIALNALPIVILQLLFFIAPLAITVALSFQETRSFMLDWTWSLKTWTDVFSRAYYWSILLRTLVMSAMTVVLCILIGFPVAYALATRLRRWENHVTVLIVFAFLTDSVLKIFGWVLFLDSSGIANAVLGWIGLPSLPGWALFSPQATLLGMVYNLLPFTIFTIFLSVSMIDRDVIRAAYDCGASKFRTLWEVTLPLSRNGIMAGGVLVFVLSLGSFLEPKVLGGGKSPMAAELIRQTFETRINWPLGSALTVVVMVIAIVTILLFLRLIDLRKKEAL